MMDTGISCRVRSVLDQLRLLAGVAGTDRIPLPTEQTTLFEIARWLREVGSSVPSAECAQWKYQILLRHFFSFLANEKLLEQDLTRHPGFEPATAIDERRASPFWQLAALVHDLWEHYCDPLVRVRDVAVLTALARLRAHRIYDLGSGACFFAFEAATSGSIVRCVETNAMKRKFTRYLRKVGGVDIVTSGVRGEFDLVLAVDVLDHMVRLAEVISCAFRRLKEGGLLLIQAEFRADGWHTGGEQVIEEVFAALHRYFVPVPSETLATHRALLFRRRQVPVCDTVPVAADTPIRTSVALRVLPHEVGKSYVVMSNSFVVRPTVLTDLGIKLLAECSDGITVGELKNSMFRRYGLDGELVGEALAELRESRILALDGATCSERSYAQQ